MQNTVQSLIRYFNEIGSWEKNGSILMHFHKYRIEEFVKKNKSLIDEVNGKIKSIEDKYFVKENDLIKYGEDKRPLIKEGLLPEDYEREMEELFEQPVKINF